MNVLNDLTIKNLKLNKKRTIVTTIGIMLSVALICAVAGMVTSFQRTLVENAIIDGGNRHITVENVRTNDLKYFLNNDQVKSMYFTINKGYALVDNLNDDKPYAYVLGYTKSAFANTTIKLVSGRLPKSNDEIIISVPFRENSKVKMGDVITLDLGKRVCEDNTELTQNNPFFINKNEEDTCQEKLVDTKSYQYKVVGIMERPDFSMEPFSAPGYTMITYQDDIDDYINISMLFKDSKYYKEYTKTINNDSKLNKYNITYNLELLRWTGASLSSRTKNMLYSVAGVVIGIIIFTSVFVIKNSFDISNQEKRKMYGMLSSIGATSKQIKKNVLHEGFILGVIGIPFGIILGVLADYILVIVINVLGEYLFNDIKFVFSISIWPIILSILLGGLTIYLSVIRAAKKSSKIAPIEAIRNNNEIKIDSKKLQSLKIVDKFLGIGGDIAYKNLKRNKKRNRTTIISIVLSVAVFISLSSFISYGFKITEQYYVDLNYSMKVSVRDDDINLIDKAYNDIKNMEGISNYSLEKSMFMDFDANKYYTKDAQIFAESGALSIKLTSVGEKEFKRILKENNISLSDYNYKGFVIDSNVIYADNKNYKHINLIDLNKNKIVKGKLNNKDLSVEIVKRLDVLPTGIQNAYSDSPTIIVSDDFYNYLLKEYNMSDDFKRSELYIKCDNADKLEAAIKKYFVSSDITSYNVMNIETEAKGERAMIILVSIFLYGFIIVISLIGITNIINTINTNVNLRRRELAMLKSIGMTKKEFTRMIRLESFMYSTKALLIGIPLGLLGSYGMYKAFASGDDYGYLMPWKATLMAIIVVYLLVNIIMYFSLKKMQNENIIDVIKDENI